MKKRTKKLKSFAKKPFATEDLLKNVCNGNCVTINNTRRFLNTFDESHEFNSSKELIKPQGETENL